ncbi:MAG: sigma 54-dependent Fis family transcriptional regulator [Deltaproteobacteria bacterium]|nr:sigma 54-dependent Fis family transcriptional regulator [Deltaproteobacteria bacterium]
MSGQARTLLIDDRADGLPTATAPRFRVRVVAGPDAGKEAEATGGRLTVGSGEGVDLRLSDRTVSRYHLELEATGSGIAVRDLDSTNGTRAGDLGIREVLASGSLDLEIGQSRLRLVLGTEHSPVEAAPSGSFGPLVGSSTAMRAVYSVLGRAAATTTPIILTGESGSGKELAARAVHESLPRASGPFEVVDCGGLPATLIESELFGHERGAFTGAVGARAGAFERGNGGTLFLDELGELPLELQPKLLRALGEGQIRRVGGQSAQRTDVRIVAATNRDLRREVNSGRFRADLFYRLAVIQIRLPPLRERLEDLPELVASVLQAIARDREIEVTIEPDAELVASLARHSWPGNVRELRNYLEHLVVLHSPPPLAGEAPATDGIDHLENAPLQLARARFEEHYVRRLLERTSGNVAEAARRAGMSRATLFRLIARHGIKSPGE